MELTTRDGRLSEEPFQSTGKLSGTVHVSTTRRPRGFNVKSRANSSFLFHSLSHPSSKFLPPISFNKVEIVCDGDHENKLSLSLSFPPPPRARRRALQFHTKWSGTHRRGNFHLNYFGVEKYSSENVTAIFVQVIRVFYPAH